MCLFQINEMLEAIDADIGYLMEELVQRKMADINVMIVSDHGFADVNGSVFLDECASLNTTLFNVTENDPVIFIWPYDKSMYYKTVSMVTVVLDLIIL